MIAVESTLTDVLDMQLTTQYTKQRVIAKDKFYAFDYAQIHKMIKPANAFT